MKFKTRLLLLTLLPVICLLCSYKQQTNAFIVGNWTQTEAVFINKHTGTTAGDTTISHDKGFAITFTDSGRYYYTAPYGHRANGMYSISNDTLYEVSAATKTSAWYKIITLTEHELILLTHNRSLSKGADTETRTHYSKQ